MERLQAQGVLPQELDVPVEITDPRDPSHGDYATSFALAAAKKAGTNPRELAERFKEELSTDDGRRTTNDGRRTTNDKLFTAVEVAGPGFLNFRIVDEAWLEGVIWANDRASEIGKPERSSALTSQRLNVEFVSVNPNGPITVGSGRGAAFGSTLCNVLEAVGNEVHREYYINDGTNSEQMRLFAETVRALSKGDPIPEHGYKGDYVSAVAAQLEQKHGKTAILEKAAQTELLAWFQHESEDAMLAEQKRDLLDFGVRFDTWFSEQGLHDSGVVEKQVDELIAKGAADDKPIRRVLKLAKGGKIEDVEIVEQPNEEVEGEEEIKESQGGSGNTLWLRSTKFGDDMDRVLRRKDGRLTYIASDVAYHKDKFNRPPNADKLITILGPDHHGYINRLHAVVAALLENLPEHKSNRPYKTYPENETLSEIEAKIYDSAEERDACLDALEESKKRLEVIIFQIVRFVKDGKPSAMRKRDGNIYSLRDLMVEIGKDAAPNATPEDQLVTGKDVARFFYLMRSHDTHMDFDIDLATKGTEENPVFYVQYAHARICSILKKAEEAGIGSEDQRVRGSEVEALHSKEQALIKKLLDLPDEVLRCAEDYGVHRLTTYAVELARTFHHFYDACRVIQPENPELTERRLEICRATKHALKGALDLLGVSAPERMDREAAA